MGLVGQTDCARRAVRSANDMTGGQSQLVMKSGLAMWYCGSPVAKGSCRCPVRQGHCCVGDGRHSQASGVEKGHTVPATADQWSCAAQRDCRQMQTAAHMLKSPWAWPCLLVCIVCTAGQGAALILSSLIFSILLPLNCILCVPSCTCCLQVAWGWHTHHLGPLQG